MSTKVCIDCKEPKRLVDFYKHPSSRDRRQSRCKPCDNAHRSGRQIKERLGFVNGPVAGKAATYLEIATVLGITKQAVEKIEKKAIVKLRKAALRMGLLAAALIALACSDRPVACRGKAIDRADLDAVMCGPGLVRVDLLDGTILCCAGDK